MSGVGPPPQGSRNLNDYGVRAEASQIGPDPNDMMSLLDDTDFATFGGMAMSLDVDDPMGQPFPSMGSSTPTQSQAPASATGEQTPGPFSALPPDDPATNTDAPLAGPSPVAGHSASQPSAGASASTLTEFTKRRNWPAKVIEEIKDFLQILDASGRIKHVSPSITALTGYKADDVQDCFLKDLVHLDDLGVFTSEFHECISTGNVLRLFYRLKKKDNTYAIFESVGHAHIAAAKFAPNPDNQSPFCQAVFIMSRPYPNKNAGLLDSFLEHKIENERLQRRIAELRREEAEETEESRRTWGLQSQEGRSDVAPSEDMTQAGATPLHTNSSAIPFHASSGANTSSTPNDLSRNAMPPPERPASLNVALTRENLEGIAGSRPDSIRDKMARYEAVTHGDTIEMLTGLRYQEGERSRGITTGNASPTLIKGDAGIAIPMERDLRTGEKKKKVKVAEEYVCTDCGTLESPEWRKGPSGPKTLCNACGLRWAKKEKKKNNNSSSNSNNNNNNKNDNNNNNKNNNKNNKNNKNNNNINNNNINNNNNNHNHNNNNNNNDDDDDDDDGGGGMGGPEGRIEGGSMVDNAG